MRRLVVQGSFHEAGRQIGLAVAPDLPFILWATVKQMVEQGVPPARARALGRLYIESTAEWFPGAFECLDGMAGGAGMPLRDLCLIAFSEEILAECGGAPTEKCSTLAAPTAQGWIVGHDEDFGPQYLGRMYALDLRIHGYPRVCSVNFSGHLLCLAGSLNEKLVAITANALWPTAVPGLSNNVKLFRAALADDMEEAIGHLATQPNAMTTHYTVAWGQADDLISVEISDLKTARQEIVAIDPGRAPIWHTNHVRYLDLLAPDPAVIGGNLTLARGDKLDALIAGRREPRDPGAMLDLLSTNDGVLHRTPAQNPTSVTLATVVIRPQTGELWVRDADPAAERRDWYFSVRPPLN